MSIHAEGPPNPILLGPDEGDARWWGDSLVIIKATEQDTGRRVSVIYNCAYGGVAAPLHIHHNEGEGFFVINGTLTFWVGGKAMNAVPGSYIYGPPGVPHTFEVTSSVARYLFVVEPGGFESFVREVAEPAQELTLPPKGRPQLSPDAMTNIAAKYGIEILGPPGIPAPGPQQ
jgi:mannose-6-phosphate isomerase-like protein (cupin superfamily)